MAPKRKVGGAQRCTAITLAITNKGNAQKGDLLCIVVLEQTSFDG